MIYSKRGPLWAELVWKSAFLHKCEILEDLLQRLVPEVERGQVGEHLPIYVITWNNDYVYMRTNNAIISNNQSKDLIAL